MVINYSHAFEAFACRSNWQVERISRRAFRVRADGHRRWHTLEAVTASGLFSIAQITSLLKGN